MHVALALAMIVCIASALLALQVPYSIARIREPAAAAGPSAALNNMAQAESLEVTKSYGMVVNTTGDLLVRQMDAWTFQWPFLAVAVIVLVQWRKDLPLLARAEVRLQNR